VAHTEVSRCATPTGDWPAQTRDHPTDPAVLNRVPTENDGNQESWRPPILALPWSVSSRRLTGDSSRPTGVPLTT